MNFLKAQDVLKGPVVPASSDAMVFDLRDGEVWVLTGIRGNDPWKGYLSLTMGGYMDPEDANPLMTAKRETVEETGQTTQQLYGLTVDIRFLVGIYGPHRWHHRLESRQEKIVAVSTGVQAHTIPVLALVFGARVTGGAVCDTDEQRGIKFMPVSTIVAEYGDRIVFDHALALSHLMEILSDEASWVRAREALKSFY